MPDPKDFGTDPHVASASSSASHLAPDLAGVLHDVSNALTVLLGWVGEARAPGASPEEIDYALTIVEQRARVARDIARHAIGGPRVDEQREIGAIVEELKEALRVEAQKAEVRLVVDGGSEAVKVAGALDVSQVLTNLVLNAVAHAPKGSAVSVLVGGDDETCAVLVSDQGPGVAPERRQRIFEGDSARPGGTGVGLRHSRALARAWGGDVELVGGGEGGARFRVSWPRGDRPNAARGGSVGRPSPMRMPLQGANELRGKRVLVVEDDQAVLDLLEAALETRGAEITVARDQRALTAALAFARFDAALVDLSPISEDVQGCLSAVHARSPGVRLILITGSPDALPDTTTSQAAELVRKPFEIPEVLAALTAKSRA